MPLIALANGTRPSAKVTSESTRFAMTPESDKYVNAAITMAVIAPKNTSIMPAPSTAAGPIVPIKAAAAIATESPSSSLVIASATPLTLLTGNFAKL